MIGRWRRLWQQPFVRLLREKYRKFRFGFPPSPFSLAFLFTPRKVLEISLKKRKEKKNVLRDIGQRANARNGRYPPESKKKKRIGKKCRKGRTNSFTRTSPRDFNGIVNSIVPEQLWPIFTDAGQPTPFLHARRPCPFTLDLTFRHVFSFDA